MFLRIPFIRRRVIFELRQNYKEELSCKFRIRPAGLQCCIYPDSSGDVFPEIFLLGEYASILEAELPKRWIDIGCNAGYFSLWLIDLLKQKDPSADFSALLIDADSRAKKKIEDMVRLNDLQEQIIFRHGAISCAKDYVEFFENVEPNKSSIVEADVRLHGAVKRVPVLTAAEIAEAFPSPYDLVKLDIEGAEADFIKCYDPVLLNCKYLIFEAHAFPVDRMLVSNCKMILADKGFILLKEQKMSCERAVILFYKNSRF